MIGDTMETDILGGVQLGSHTVLVLSGGTRREDLPRYAYRPEIVIESLGEFAAQLDKTNWQPQWHAPVAALNGHAAALGKPRRLKRHSVAKALR